MPVDISPLANGVPVFAARVPGVYGPAGDAASPDSIRRLSQEIASMKGGQRKALDLVRSAVAAIRVHDFEAGSRRALKALEHDERMGQAWHALAICREKLGHFVQAISAYEAAVKLLPDETEVAHDLARLAQRLGYKDISEKLQRRFLAANPGHVEATNNLASLLREQKRYSEAIELLSQLIQIEPHHALLWNTLGSVLSDQGQMAESMTFFDESLRLNPEFAKARFNRGSALHGLGRSADALEDMEAALPGAEPGYERAMMVMARGMAKLATGDIIGGMADYEERFNPHMPDAPHFIVDSPRWDPAKMDIAGKTLLVAGEQGLADEMVFANCLADVIEAVGPKGRVYVAVEKRLVDMFQRSHPTAVVGPHTTISLEGRVRRFLPFLEEWTAKDGPVDAWIPLGALTPIYRPTVEAFPAQAGHLVADPARVAHWKAELEKLGPGLKIGLHWKSLVLSGARARYFSAFERWKPVLTAPGCIMINLQCGDVAEDLAAAEAAGISIWTPPFDLKDDLEDLAAISMAADLVIGPGIAGTNLAASVGARTWMAVGPDDWHTLGTDHYPFYPHMRCFPMETMGDWPALMERMRVALGEAVEARWS
ncbi:MAG: tetratricopeptide repeat protein [Brevundimonas sp.]|uniref:tetratricopeptide repeat protein n=1 Tax=Brevundimonas sp. TaxID=1871086 RepID=UPI001224E67A|nr:tetratricopeptide repeat protein [Brevundimonas sp.]RZJ17641.1 MAG: tetratricopeptide repeat protein [Brevundimonas sp.]